MMESSENGRGLFNLRHSSALGLTYKYIYNSDYLYSTENTAPLPDTGAEGDVFSPLREGISHIVVLEYQFCIITNQ